MVLDLITYALNQNHDDFLIEEIDSQLLKLQVNKKKFIIYYTDISSSGAGRNKDELRIQLSIAIKLKLFGYTAEDFNILLIGFDKNTNTFTFWKYDKDINLNTKQSLYTRKKILFNAKNNGYDSYYYKKRDAFNRRQNERSISLSVNAFLFPLVIKEYSKIFNKDYLKEFSKKIKRFNFLYSKDEMLLCLDLYGRERKLKNIDKKDPLIPMVSDLCKLRFKILGFSPSKYFFPDNELETLRNEAGIYTKIINFKDTDPNVKGGLSGGARKAQKKLWDEYSLNGQLDKKRLLKNSKSLIKSIRSKNIEELIGIKKNIKKSIFGESSQLTDIFSSYERPTDLTEIDLNEDYKNRVINTDNVKDKIEANNLIDKASETHQRIVKELGEIFSKNGYPILKNERIDFYSVIHDIGKLFEVKSFTESNFNTQLRHGIIQLKEYYFIFAKYKKIIPLETNLFLCMENTQKNLNPGQFLNNIQKEFLIDQKIKLCWINNKKILDINDIDLFNF
tara:strand:+ start:478 stop:1992 length:1515 start_codon:yes stop_codon:yes gene_type:complete